MPRVIVAAVGTVVLLGLTACAVSPSDLKDQTPPSSTAGLVAIVNASTTADRVYEGQFCGGTAVTTDLVTTAAHCVRGRSIETISVAHGNTDVCDTDWIVNPITDIQFDDEVALLRIAGTLEVARVGSLDVSAPLVARGWGRHSVAGTYPCESKAVLLEHTSLEDCVSLEKRPDLSGVFCARPEIEENTCSGDSGGPVYQRLNGLDVVVGIVEGGIGCGPSDDGIYTELKSRSDLWAPAP